MKPESGVVFFPCRDINETREYYTGVLGLEVCKDLGKSIWIDCGYGYLGFVEYEPQRPMAQGACISFNLGSVQEVDAMYEKLRALPVIGLRGAPQRHPVFPVYSFFFSDPNGYTLEFQKTLDGGKEGKEMKTLYLVGGTMGVGKTAACQRLKKMLPKAVFLDGDWCWDADPFTVTEETKAMAVDNICHVLNNFLGCSAYENVIFCWVMHEQAIIDGLMRRLHVQGCAVKCVSLVCSERALRQRLEKDVAAGVREADVIARSIARIGLYEKLDTVKIDTTEMDAQQAAEAIAAI